MVGHGDFRLTKKTLKTFYVNVSLVLLPTEPGILTEASPPF